MPSDASPRKKKSRAYRPKFARPSEEMRRLFSLLGEELLTYPDVTTRPMFGLTGFYRRGIIFAALPRTRAIGAANEFIFKMNAAPKSILNRAANDPHIHVSHKGIAGWQSFTLAEEYDLNAAQRWLDTAWKYAVKQVQTKK